MIMNERHMTYRDYFLLLAVTALTLLVYSSAVHFEFTNWDDDIHVTNNPAVQHLSLRSVMDLFTPTEKYMYHPLTMLSYMIEWSIVGDSPRLYHATNIALHLINSWLLFFLLFRLSRNKYLALLIASIFALHPLQCESVAWISARKDLLSGMFALVSALSYYRWKEKNDLRMYFTSIVLFLFSLLSKPTAVVLPLIFILYDMWQEKGFTWSLLKDKFIFIAISIFFTIFIVLTMTSHSELPMHYYSYPQRITLVLYEVSFYVFKFIIPADLSACYSYPRLINGALPTGYYLIAMISLVMIVTTFIFRRKIQSVSAGMLLYGVVLLPVLQIIPFNNASLVADRYAYLGVVGLSFAILGLFDIVRTRIKPTGIIVNVAVIMLIVSLSYMSFKRLPVWNDSVALFTDVISKDPNTAIAYGNRANARISKGDYAGAIDDCATMLLLYPGEPKAYYNRGNAYSELKKPKEALADYSKAIVLGFQSPNVFYNRGNQYMAVKAYDSAAADYKTVLRLSPAYLAALVMLDSISTSVKNDVRSSLYYLTQYIAFYPDDAAVYYKRARSNAELGFIGAAMNDAAVAVSLNRNLDTTDQFITTLNRAIDSINTKILVISLSLAAKENSARSKLLFERSALYESLGDTLRAKKDRLESVSMRERGLNNK